MIELEIETHYYFYYHHNQKLLKCASIEVVTTIVLEVVWVRKMIYGINQYETWDYIQMEHVAIPIGTAVVYRIIFRCETVKIRKHSKHVVRSIYYMPPAHYKHNPTDRLIDSHYSNFKPENMYI